MIAALLHAGFFAANLESVAATASLCILAGMVCMVVFNTLTAPRAGGQKSPTVFPKVSLLVPARNEAHNVPILAAHFEKLEYPNLEIILLDDASDDGTGAALGDLVNLPALRGRARSLRGAELPTGWLGKNWACHQLAQTSSGDVLIFCDADARPGPQAVTRTVALLEHYGVGCATLMPRQVLGSWAERAVIPVLLHISLFCFLPIALVPRLRWKRLGVGNGQWLSFRRSAYAAVGGHAGVRDKVVEDIALAQRAQTHGNGLVVGLATDTLAVRMYRNFREVWDGFGKNVFVLTGGTLWQTPFFGLFFALIHILPWLLFLLHPQLWGLPLALLLVCRVLTARALGEPLGAIAGQVAGSILVPLIVARSLFDFRFHRLQWKGRILNAGPPPVQSLAQNRASKESL